MAEYILHLAEEENVVLSAHVVHRLIEGGNGDAALLYLCLARYRGSAKPERLRESLRWDEATFAAAEEALRKMGLLASPALPAGEEAGAQESAPPPQPPKPKAKSVPRQTREETTPQYSREDVARVLEKDTAFHSLLREVERKLGPLSEPSVRKLLGLYENLGLSADVIFLLVSHCISRKEAQLGAGKLPTMREIEKEGYYWAERGLLTSEAANDYLRREQEKQKNYPAYMAVLQLGDRACAPAEEQFLSAWSDMGFPPETVAIAYNKTVLRCHEFKWNYCNGILRRWHEKGLHSPDEVSAEGAAPKQTGTDRNAWMDEYI